MAKVLVVADCGEIVEVFDDPWAIQLEMTPIRDAEPLVCDVRYALFRARRVDEENAQENAAQLVLQGVA